MNATELGRALGELAPATEGARLDQIWQQPGGDLVLRFRREQDILIIVSPHPRRPRVHRIWERPPAPAQPPDFCRALRKAIRGWRLLALEQPAPDRWLRLRFVGRDDPDHPLCERQLQLELFGARSNLLLVDEEGVVRYVWRVGTRDRVPGARYQAPKTRADQRPPRFPDIQPDPEQMPLNRAWADHYRQLCQEEARRERTGKLLKRLRRAHKKAARHVEHLEADVERAEEAPSLRQEAELLAAHFHLLKRGQHRVEVTDYYADPPAPRTIELDARQAPQEQVDRRFKRARKLERGAELAAERLEEAWTLRDRLAELIRAAEAEPEPAELEGLEQTADQLLPRKRQRGRRGRKGSGPAGPLRFTSRDGLDITVGRNARENDKVTRSARGNDIFLHIVGYPGAHVIIHCPKGGSAPLDTLLDAAQLAIVYSKLKGKGRLEVSYTRCKHVRKPKGAPPGLVTVSQVRTLLVDLDEERLQRLMQTRQ